MLKNQTELQEAEGQILYTQLVKWCSPAWEEPKFS